MKYRIPLFKNFSHKKVHIDIATTLHILYTYLYEQIINEIIGVKILLIAE